MVADTIFFWVLPLMFAVFTAVLIAVARAEGEPGSARKGAAAFGIGVLAIILDTQRAFFPGWFFTVAVPLHWLVVIYVNDAFLARHGDAMPRALTWGVFAAGLGVNLFATFVVDSVAVRVPNASIVAIALIAIALPRYFRPKLRILDRLVAGAMIAAWSCYIIRFAVYFLLDQSGEYAQHSAWSQYMMMFYFSSGVIGLTLAFLLILAVTSDLVERHHAASTIDPLTGIANRRGYDLMVEAQVTSGHSIGAVMMIDLDRFKALNDEHGHATGDAVLAATGRVLVQGCAGFADIARLGGEEFAVLVHATHREAAPQLADLLRASIASIRLEPSLPNVMITASIGLAQVGPGESVGAAMRRADIAMYRAKNGGRNRCEMALSETAEELAA